MHTRSLLQIWQKKNQNNQSNCYDSTELKIEATGEIKSKLTNEWSIMKERVDWVKKRKVTYND